MSLFSDQWRRNASAIDRTFGDTYCYIPMAIVNGRPAPDPVRLDYELVGALVEQPHLHMALDGKRVAANTASPIASSETIIDFETCALGYPPKNGDRIRNNSTGAVYEVTSSRPDGMARTAVSVILKVGPT